MLNSKFYSKENVKSRLLSGKKAIIFSVVALALMMSACNNSSEHSAKFHAADTTTLAKGASYYSCPMHPDQVSDSTGSCPVCGDDLVKQTKQ